MNSYLSVVRQVPEFVRADYPTFVKFIQQYYKWYETVYAPNRIDDLLDIDDTVDEFVKYFRNQLDVYGITADLDDRNYLKQIKQLYTTKGTFAGIDLLLRIIYNRRPTVTTPWDYVFKPSDGKWHQDTSILVTMSSGNADDLVGNQVVFTDRNQNTYRTFVTHINTRPSGVVELFVNRFSPTSIINSFRSVDETITGFCQQTTTTVKVERGGYKFSVGQVFAINTSSGSGTLVKVKTVDRNGSIKAAEIITFGAGYSSDFNFLISPSNHIDLASLGSRIQLSTAANQTTYQTDDNANAQNERGLLVYHDYTNVNTSYASDLTYVGDVVGEITSHSSVDLHDTNYASLRFTIGSLCVYPGHYVSNDNIIGDVVVIQDSQYYQPFSYVTAVDADINLYSKLLRATMHPAGTKHFAIYQMNYDFQLNPEVDPTLNIIAKKDAIRDFAATLDEIRFAIGSYFNTEYATVSDALTRYANYIRTYGQSEIVTVTEQISNALSKVGVTDAVVVTDVIGWVPIIPLADAFTIAAAITSFNYDKYMSDNVHMGLDPTSGAYHEPYYVEPLSPSPYWRPEYLTDERAFTN